MQKNAIIVGAGIIGATTALALAEQGYKITVVDQAKNIAAGTSAKNGAQLSYSYADALASPQTLKTLPKLIAGLDPAFRLSPELNQDFLNWGKLFIKNCTHSKADSNTLAILEIALKSCVKMNKWQAKYTFDFDYRPAGKLYLYADSAGLAKARNMVKLKSRLGVKQEIVLKDKLLEIEPMLKDFNGKLAGAVYAPDDAVGDATKFAKAALTQAAKLSEVNIYLDTKITGFLKKGGKCQALKTSRGELEADKIIICAGFQTKELLKKLDVSLPIMPVAGYSLTYRAPANSITTSITDTAKKTVLCKIGDKIRIAGMADMGLITDEPPAARITKLIKTAKQRFPSVADYKSDSEPWVGIRPMTPDSRPIIQKCGADNLWVNCGHGMLGWTLAAGSADILKTSL